MSTMNTETTAEDTQNQGQESPEPQESTGTPPEESNDLAKIRKEAAAHRVAAKEAKAELEASSGRLKTAQDALLAAELKRQGIMLTPAALNAVGLRDSVFADSGEIDPEALHAALDTARGTFGLELRHQPNLAPNAGETSPIADDRFKPTWSDALKRTR